MRPFALRILAFLTLCLGTAASLQGQEVLRASRIQARGLRRMLPSLGLPVRTDGGDDAGIRFKDGLWSGKDDPLLPPRWYMCEIFRDSIPLPVQTGAVMHLVGEWIREKPERPVSLVCGPLGSNWFVAVCKRRAASPGWKSIGFVIPPEGVDPARSLYAYSVSVNWLEYRTGYNFFPKLPAHLQEIIEEMTAAELLCPFIESDGIDPDIPDPELNPELEEDFREYG